jgi:hypothetical protein
VKREEWNQILIELEDLKREKIALFKKQQALAKHAGKLAQKERELEERQREWFYKYKAVKEVPEKQPRQPRKKRPANFEEMESFKNLSEKDKEVVRQIMGGIA